MKYIKLFENFSSVRFVRFSQTEIPQGELTPTLRRKYQEIDEDIVELNEEKEKLQEIDQIISVNIPIVYMTGTYLKPLLAFKIPQENVVIWDYQDLQNAKRLEDNDTNCISS